jgi:D-methionine transport system ATP-binding protein
MVVAFRMMDLPGDLPGDLSGNLSEQASQLLTLDRLGLRLGQRSDRKGKVLSPGTPIFSEVSLAVRSGERLGLVGRSGSGKTALLRLLNRLIEPTQGKLYYQGKPYDQIPIAHLRRQILYVPQEPKLLKSTALEAIQYAMQLHGIQDDSRLKHWCDRLELSQTVLTKSEVELSLGQKQWVAIARALVLETPILLLDEPTAAIDPWMRDRLYEVLQGLPNRTILIASPDLDWLRSLCPQALLIADRRITQGSDWLGFSEQLRSSSSPDEEW